MMQEFGIHYNTYDTLPTLQHLYSSLQHLYSSLHHLYSSLHHLYSSLHHLYSSLHHLYSSLHHLYSSLHHLYSSLPVLKVGFDPDQLTFNEDAGEVRVCSVILTPLDQVSITAVAVFTIFAEPGTARSRPLPTMMLFLL